MLQLIPFDIGDVDKLLINYIHLIKGCTIAKGKHLSMKIYPFLVLIFSRICSAMFQFGFQSFLIKQNLMG